MSDSLSRWRQPHDFRHHHEAAAERRLRWVITITLLTMIAELAGGYAFGSMALVADGWHMLPPGYPPHRGVRQKASENQPEKPGTDGFHHHLPPRDHHR